MRKKLENHRGENLLSNYLEIKTLQPWAGSYQHLRKASTPDGIPGVRIWWQEETGHPLKPAQESLGSRWIQMSANECSESRKESFYALHHLLCRVCKRLGLRPAWVLLLPFPRTGTTQSQFFVSASLDRILSTWVSRFLEN